METKKKFVLEKLREHPEIHDKAAAWFSEKWGVPKEAYYESIDDCIKGKTIPQWYVIFDDKNNIIAGTGVIENDFHQRKDLSPNLCALFVEEQYRCQGIAGMILSEVRQDLADLGVETLYLITNHIDFYERYGWEFLTMVTDDDNESIRMYVAPTKM